VSGIIFHFDPKKKYLNRVPADRILINGSPLDMDKEYTVTVRDYIFEGFDGYDELPKCKNIDHTNDITNMFDICLKFFQVLKQDELESFGFGFEESNERINRYMEEYLVVKDEIKCIRIETEPRIFLI
jgi:hypothetical protein